MADPIQALPDRIGRGCKQASRPALLLVSFTALIFASLHPGRSALGALQEESSASRPPYVSASTVKSWLSEGKEVLFLDVRVPEEYAAAHLPNAINIYYSEVTAVADRLPPGDPLIVVYCTHSAYRALAAAKILREVGVSSTYVLEGGIVAWQSGGLTILAENLDEQPRILPPPDCICGEVKKT